MKKISIKIQFLKIHYNKPCESTTLKFICENPQQKHNKKMLGLFHLQKGSTDCQLYSLEKAYLQLYYLKGLGCFIHQSLYFVTVKEESQVSRKIPLRRYKLIKISESEQQQKTVQFVYSFMGGEIIYKMCILNVEGLCEVEQQLILPNLQKSGSSILDQETISILKQSNKGFQSEKIREQEQQNQYQEEQQKEEPEVERDFINLDNYDEFGQDSEESENLNVKTNKQSKSWINSILQYKILQTILMTIILGIVRLMDKLKFRWKKAPSKKKQE